MSSTNVADLRPNNFGFQTISFQPSSNNSTLRPNKRITLDQYGSLNQTKIPSWIEQRNNQKISPGGLKGRTGDDTITDVSFDGIIAEQESLRAAQNESSAIRKEEMTDDLNPFNMKKPNEIMSLIA